MGEPIYFVLGGIISVFIVAFFYYLYLLINKKRQEKYTPQRSTKFKCIDGHLTRSKGELIIDNHLTRLNIKHEYENQIRVHGHPIKCDWYLPEFDIYIEYWGYFGKDYLERKREKIQLYEIGNLKLISIEDIMLENIYKNLEEQLKKYIELNETKQKSKFCPNCGDSLDSRF
ncbi:MAG: hypothetical protein GF317_10345 [Candidatus Lokiarchaeota archaeon]|nr:hypothetical protein [Candidatus Lokiarchaeota archaeon]MBD3200053.1 hypothetical protein [Candidatus Lokiarchaeota archaeon]